MRGYRVPAESLDRIARAYDRAAASYRDWRWSVLWDEIELASVIDALPHSGLVLDLGCGDGRYSQPCRLRGLAYLGVDVSAEMLRHARTDDRNGLIHADAQTFRTAMPVEAVICTRVLSNLPHIEGILTSIAANLLPGGTFVVTDFDERHDFQRQTIPSAGGEVFIPVYRHGRAQLRAAMRDAGLSIVHEQTICARPGTPLLSMYTGVSTNAR